MGKAVFTYTPLNVMLHVSTGWVSIMLTNSISNRIEYVLCLHLRFSQIWHKKNGEILIGSTWINMNLFIKASSPPQLLDSSRLRRLVSTDPWTGHCVPETRLGLVSDGVKLAELIWRLGRKEKYPNLPSKNWCVFFKTWKNGYGVCNIMQN